MVAFWKKGTQKLISRADKNGQILAFFRISKKCSTLRGCSIYTPCSTVILGVSGEISCPYLPFGTYWYSVWPLVWSQMAPEKSVFCDPPRKAHLCPCSNEGVFGQTYFWSFLRNFVTGYSVLRIDGAPRPTMVKNRQKTRTTQVGSLTFLKVVRGTWTYPTSAVGVLGASTGPVTDAILFCSFLLLLKALHRARSRRGSYRNKENKLVSHRMSGHVTAFSQIYLGRFYFLSISHTSK